MTQTPEEARAELARARLRLAVAMDDVTNQVRRHTGLRLGKRWALPLAAAAAGLSTAWLLRRRKKKRELDT